MCFHTRYSILSIVHVIELSTSVSQISTKIETKSECRSRTVSEDLYKDAPRSVDHLSDLSSNERDDREFGAGPLLISLGHIKRECESKSRTSVAIVSSISSLRRKDSGQLARHRIPPLIVKIRTSFRSIAQRIGIDSPRVRGNPEKGFDLH